MRKKKHPKKQAGITLYEGKDARGRWLSGHSGNYAGRPRLPNTLILQQALERVKAKKKIDLIDYAVELAYKDTTVLLKILDKIIPSLTASAEIRQTVSGETIRKDVVLQAAQERLKDWYDKYKQKQKGTGN